MSLAGEEPRARTDLSGLPPNPGLRDRRITADYVAEALRAAIASGELPDGAVLNQAAIAAHLGVSRVPVREAMRELHAEGLIETRAHRGAVVRGLDQERFVEVYSLRALLEGWLVEQAVPRTTTADLEAAVALNEEMRDVTDHGRWLDLNAQFHRMLYAPSGAQTTLEVLEQLRARAERYVRLWSRGSGVHRPHEASAEHDAVIARVAAGDAAGARTAIERHVERTRDTVIAQRAAGEGRAP